MTKEFMFLYPIPEYIQAHSEGMVHLHKQEFRKKYAEALNHCIDVRYRQTGFGINYVLFKNHEIAKDIVLVETDKIIFGDIDFKVHTTPQLDGSYAYTNSKIILESVGNISKLVVAGFHAYDCVERVAKYAYESGLDVLVDEDLTEWFGAKFRTSTFNPKKFMPPELLPSCEFIKEESLRIRKSKPWFVPYKK